MTHNQPPVRASGLTRLIAYAKQPEIARLIRYVVIGGLTTAVNYLLYVLLTRLFLMAIDPSQWIAVCASVVFAYVTNKIFVFRSHCGSLQALFKEMGSFFGARAVTVVLESIGVHAFCVQLGWNDLLVKGALTLVVLILNYVASKIFVFRAEKRGEAQ